MLEHVPLTTFVAVLALGPGRRVVALREIRRNAIALRLDELARVVEAALAADLEFIELRRNWRAARAEVPADPLLANMEARMDRLLSGLRRDIADIAMAAPNTDPRRGAARRLRLGLLLDGCGRLDGAPLLDEARWVVAELLGVRRDDSVLLGLDPRVAILRGLLDAYAERSQLIEEAAAARAASWSDVRAADDAGLRRLRGVIARVLGRFPGESPADRDARSRLLRSVVAQQEALRVTYRRRQPVNDVDPDTGEPEPAPVALPLPIAS